MLLAISVVAGTMPSQLEMMNCSHSRVLNRRRRCYDKLLKQWNRQHDSRRFALQRLASTAAGTCVANNTRSQYEEDLLLLPLLIDRSSSNSMASRGSFVELGALDGERYSNTWLLEKCFGWSGVLIEANPTNFEALARSGRRAAKLHSAVCAVEGTVRMTVAGGEVSGQVGAMADKFVQNWQHRNRPDATVAVPCAPLSALIARSGMQGADLLSLDVEGAEALVLRTVDTSVFRVVLVEMDGLSIGKDEEVHQLLTAGGLVHLTDFQIPNSRVYARPGSSPRRRARSGRLRAALEGQLSRGSETVKHPKNH